MKVRKGVIPAAGFGTRFLPATRTIPKVMLPVLDTPSLHYVVEEAVQAGIQSIAVVVSERQDTIGRYFESMPQLRDALQRRGDADLLARMAAIEAMARVDFVYQKEPLGLGHAVLMARDFVGREPFAVFLPDDLIWNDSPTIGDMEGIFDDRKGAVVAVKEVPDEMVHGLGIIEAGPMDGRVCEVLRMVEKPRLEEAPSNLAVVGRYVLPPDIFDALEQARPGALGEIQLTDAIAALMETRPVYAYRFPGAHFDAGTPLGLLKASIYRAMQDEDTRVELTRWLAQEVEALSPGLPRR